MQCQLTLYPDHQCPAVSRIEIDVNRWGGSMLDLRYRIYGDMAALALPSVAAPARADGLWEQTCLEAFVREQGQAGYRELNFAPSTAWAAYGFSSYRTGMMEAAVTPQSIAVRHAKDRFELDAALYLDLDDMALWSIGLSAIIAETSGNKSCWALHHPAGKADFHHDDGFAMTLSGTAV
jgi:hypothetical protein